MRKLWKTSSSEKRFIALRIFILNLMVKTKWNKSTFIRPTASNNWISYYVLSFKKKFSALKIGRGQFSLRLAQWIIVRKLSRIDGKYFSMRGESFNTREVGRQIHLQSWRPDVYIQQEFQSNMASVFSSVLHQLFLFSYSFSDNISS